MMSPSMGFVLAPSQRYAFVVLKTLPDNSTVDSPEAFQAALAGDGPERLVDGLGALASCLESDELALDDVAVATVFTTQDPIFEAKALRDAVADPEVTIPPELTGFAPSAEYSVQGEYTAYEGTFEVPIFQSGEPPYSVVGEGGFAFDDNGRPVLQRWEEVPVIVTLPADVEGPLPVAIYVSGTGASQWGFAGGTIHTSLNEAGFAVVSYMAQFHGDRNTSNAETTLSTYNFLNPTAGRSVLRQQIADSSYVVRLIREAMPGTMPVELDPNGITFIGHSQGAQNGAYLAAVEPEIDTYVLNGLATYLAITITERKDIVDFEALARASFRVQRNSLDRFYPTIQLMQLGGEAVDPHNYHRAWAGWEGNPSGANTYVLNGLQDDTTHPDGINDATISAGAPPISPPGWNSDPEGVWGVAPEALPIQGNFEAFDGTLRTRATFLDARQGHFTIHRVPAARRRAMEFLRSSRPGVPEIPE